MSELWKKERQTASLHIVETPGPGQNIMATTRAQCSKGIQKNIRCCESFWFLIFVVHHEVSSMATLHKRGRLCNGAISWLARDLSLSHCCLGDLGPADVEKNAKHQNPIPERPAQEWNWWSPRYCRCSKSSMWAVSLPHDRDGIKKLHKHYKRVLCSFILYLLDQAAVNSIPIRFRRKLAVKLGWRIIIHCIKSVYL